ncbi:MAG: TonB-dependent receptor, partial [Hyphomonadaceae bacterium]|nr:TonB-dependent receptor [Hyphomonadaceae bacterium]
ADFLGGEIYGALYFDDAALGADWSFDASLDFVSAELDSGENVPYLPPVTLNAGAEAAWDSFSLGAAITLAGEQDDPGLGQLPTDSYTTLDLRAEADLALLGLPENTASAFLEARNVTDEEVRHATSVLKDIVPAPGQNIRAGLKLTF